MEIQKLVLYSNDINEQLHLYHHVLGMKLVFATDEEIGLQAGSTQFIFRQRENEFLYHYCFLIPNKKIEEAMVFLKDKGIELLTYKGEQIVHFTSGRSVYFYDADGHIAEFIERPSLGYESGEPFSFDSVLKVNEIGMPVENPLEVKDKLIEKYNIDLSKPEVLRADFCWVGDYNGVLLVPKIGRDWVPTEHPATMNDFEIEFASRNEIYHLNIVENAITTQSNQ